MASSKQIELFRRLTEQRDFGQQDVNALRVQFQNLTDRNASAWIERALDLPKKDETAQDESFIPPTF